MVSNLTTMAGKVILITGASSGLGLALLRLAVERGYRVVGTARNASMLRFRHLKIYESENLLLRPLDVTEPAQREALIEEIDKQWGGVDILVNNAGIAYRSVIEHMSVEDELLQLQTNFLGPMALTRLVLPGMRRKRAGHITNISSVGGMMAMPTMGSYSASKFALEGASEALWYELRPWNIKVILIQPGFIHSNAFRNVYWTRRSKSGLTHTDDYQRYYIEMQNFVEKFMILARATPASVSKKIMAALERSNPPLRIPVTIDAQLFGIIRRILPRRLYHGILYRNLPGIAQWGKIT